MNNNEFAEMRNKLIELCNSMFETLRKYFNNFKERITKALKLYKTINIYSVCNTKLQRFNVNKGFIPKIIHIQNKNSTYYCRNNC